ncbi:hemolysin family protein [Corynebacterium glucuronolyticum]|uniref:HlyC/CorC family transporter n=2 Tax=Corynebacterium glucuronolyticum TaxID=39791 RepID=A0A7T4EHQ3_9CORY|nr:hemolysin family protein [Corynebacterium glucuronolyticum]EEI26935.1 CBS domain protein [Corynebacterium glucuronolyticum ATCC 51867]EEI62215.1 CBS domain protein [Corynebacterium glucuronolyticum ATCC 51866]MCT1441545.1 hemolysin family protein [Corynebacterium glucuronolyticum]MCT1562933.1 hemolysin family protein [Corynebacterium glucuronolyticum]QQB47517.1 HlyC/CorC family transporter [Corynebacterium glucuronolyticum]
MEPFLYSFVALVALVLSGLCRTVDSALSGISVARVEEMVKDDVRGAARLRRVAVNRATHINLMVLAQTVLDVTAAVFAGAVAFEVFDRLSVAMVVTIVVMSLISYVFVGVLPRTLGKQSPYSTALAAAPILSVLATVFGPVAKLLIWVGNKVTPGGGFREGPYSTEVELREMVDIAQEKGVVEVDERRMIQSVFDLAQTTARSVMVPRTDMIWIEADKSAGQATTLCVRSGHSRIPVIGESVDDIVGIVYLKDLVAETYSHADGGTSVLVKDIMRDANFVPDSKNLDDLLHDMQRLRNHIAVLVDEYGAIAGLISIEDILEEIVGEIADEYDDKEVAPIVDLEADTYRVVSRLSLEDLNDLVKETYGKELTFSEDILDTVDTVGGLIAYELGRVPLPGSTVHTCGMALTAEGKRDRRGRMRVTSVVVTVYPDELGAGYDQGDNSSPSDD